MCKCYHLTQKPVRALGWKASAVLASLISHPSLILSVTQSAWLQCSSGLLLHKLGCGLWAQRSCECSGGWSCRYHSLAWAGAGACVWSLPGGWSFKWSSMRSCNLQETPGFSTQCWCGHWQSKGWVLPASFQAETSDFYVWTFSPAL